MIENETTYADQMSYAEDAIDYNDLIKDTVFKGEYSPEVILEGLHEQFENYINTEDHTNYVDIFFNQYHESYNYIMTEDADDHPEERNEILSNILDKFISEIAEMFDQRLGITITAIESGSTNIDEIEPIICKLYEFFILNARNNFIKAISGNMISKLPKNIEDNREFIRECNSLIMEYNPLIITITVEQFMKYCGGDELIVDNIIDNKWSGNFLKKYSPKLYQNENLTADIITNVAILYDMKGRINNG